MKKLYATGLLLFAAASLKAQPKNSFLPAGRDPFMAASLQKQIDKQQAKTTTANKSAAIKQRLVGTVNRSYSGGNYVADSGRIYYSGTYGSAGLQHNFQGSYAATFYAQNMYNKPLVVADSVVRFYAQASTPIGVPAFRSAFAYTYDADTNILTSVSRNTGGSPTTTVNTYHSNGNLKTSVTGTSLYRWFNTNGNVARDSGATQETLYFYTGTLPDSSLTTLRVATSYTGGNGITFNQKYQKTFSTFNADGYYTLYMQVAYDSLRTTSDTASYYAASGFISDAQNRLVSYQYFSGAAPSSSSLWKSDYTYAGNFGQPVDIRNSQFLNGAFVLQFRNRSNLNSNGDQDTLYNYWVNGGVDTLTEKIPILLSADGYIEKLWKLPYDAVAGTFGAAYDSTIYFYETYNDPTGVKNATLAQMQHLGCPNPLRDMLYIITQEPWTITDLSGRKLASGNVPYDLSVENWPAGIYILKTKDGYQKLMKQ